MEEYQPGQLFQPKEAYEMYVLASYFEPKYQDLVNGLAHKGEFNKSVFTWDRVLITALRG